MKAAVVESAGQVRVRELPTPDIGPYEARCQMLFGSVCAGTDTHLVQHHAPFCYWVKPPFILGHESVGRVTEVGAKVRHYKVGDVITRVGAPAVGDVTSGWGGFSDMGIATDWRAMQADGLDGWQSFTVQQILPPDIDPATGTLFITWRETFSYARRMGIASGHSLLIIGSGGNALAFAAHAKNLGAKHVIVVGSASRADDARRAGATRVLDYRSDSSWKQIKDDFPDGVDFVIESVGKASMVTQAQNHLKTGGTLGIYGLDEAGKITLSPGRTFTFYNGGYDEAEAHEPVLNFYRAGKLIPAIWHDRSQVFDLNSITTALEHAAQRTLIKPLVRLG